MMNKKVRFAALFLSTLWVGGLASTAQAGLLGFEFEAALGIWNPSLSGDSEFLGDKLDDSFMGLDSDTEMQYRFKVEHPLPLIPDAQIKYTPLSLDGSNSSAQTFTFGGTTYSADLGYTTDLELNTMDLTLFYHLPLLELLSFDTFDVRAGATIRKIDGDISIEQETTNFHDGLDYTAYLPMLYVGGTFEPFDWLSVSMDLNAVAYDGHHWYDATLQGQYGFLSNWAFVGLGYRYQSIGIKDLEDLTLDMTVDGAFAEVGLRF